MKKQERINFRHLKFAVPVILLPCTTFFYALANGSFDTKKPPEITVSTAQINSDLQAPDLERSQTLNKFDALSDAYEHKEDFSAIKGIEMEEDKNMELDNKDLYSMGEMNKINQMNMEDKLGIPKVKTPSNYAQFKKNETGATPPLKETYGQYGGSGYTAQYKSKYAEQSRDFENYVNTINGKNGVKPTENYNKPPPPPKSRFDEEMALFKAQMTVIDSITTKKNLKDGDNPLSESGEKTNANNQSQPSISDNSIAKVEIKEVRKAGMNSQRHFNTLGDGQKNSFIKAILDEGLKVYDGSRVRIRLMDDIIVDNTPLSKGSYLFGIISGFATQRVFVSITSIVYDSRITNVKLEVFDYDGMRGLYIPESLFREISKEAGAQAVGNGNITFSGGSQVNATQLAYQAAQDAYRTSTRAMSDAIRKRKAILKYNTMVYLVGDKD
jgi:conjugative transposon TraM protein